MPLGQAKHWPFWKRGALLGHEFYVCVVVVVVVEVEFTNWAAHFRFLESQNVPDLQEMQLDPS